jgi:hypothetical protein
MIGQTMSILGVILRIPTIQTRILSWNYSPFECPNNNKNIYCFLKNWALSFTPPPSINNHV